MLFRQIKLEERRHSAATQKETGLGSDIQTVQANWLFNNLGSNYSGLEDIKAVSSFKIKLLSYRLYRLIKTTHGRTCIETGKVKDFIKLIEIHLRRYHFNGEDSIRVLDFQDRFTRDSKIQQMWETQVFVTLPSYLYGSFFLVNMTQWWA